MASSAVVLEKKDPCIPSNEPLARAESGSRRGSRPLRALPKSAEPPGEDELPDGDDALDGEDEGESDAARRPNPRRLAFEVTKTVSNSPDRARRRLNICCSPTPRES